MYQSPSAARTSCPNFEGHWERPTKDEAALLLPALVSAAMSHAAGGHVVAAILPAHHPGRLSQGMVTSMEQDRFGFMWFATKDGLNRYDGHHFQVYRHDVDGQASVIGNYITVVHEGPHGDLWVGTASRGLDVFQRSTERFRHIELEFGERGGYVMNIAHDARQHLGRDDQRPLRDPQGR